MLFALVSCLGTLRSSLLVFDFIDIVHSVIELHDYGSFLFIYHPSWFVSVDLVVSAVNLSCDRSMLCFLKVRSSMVS